MILLVMEHDRGTPRRGAVELVATGRALAASSGLPLAGLVLGGETGELTASFAAYLPRLYVVRDARLEQPRPEALTRGVVGAIETLEASLVLLPASRSGLSCAPRVAIEVGGSYLENVTSVRIESDTVVATRPAYLSRISATVVAEATPAVVTLNQSSSQPAVEHDGPCEVIDLELQLGPDDERTQVTARSPVAKGRVALEDADVVVCGGRGLGSVSAFDEHVLGLASELGAGVGATRPVVDAGWRPFADLVGQTGKTIAPKLCITLGVSGAAQFVSGMNRSGVIVAVNSDAQAPIFRLSDYGIVGDVDEIVPALARALGSQR